MDNIPEVTPHEKKKKIHFNLRIIRQSHNSSLEITKNILETSSVTLIDRCKKHRYYKDSKLLNLLTELKILSCCQKAKWILSP